MRRYRLPTVILGLLTVAILIVSVGSLVIIVGVLGSVSEQAQQETRQLFASQSRRALQEEAGRLAQILDQRFGQRAQTVETAAALASQYMDAPAAANVPARPLVPGAGGSLVSPPQGLSSIHIGAALTGTAPYTEELRRLAPIEAYFRAARPASAAEIYKIYWIGESNILWHYPNIGDLSTIAGPDYDWKGDIYYTIVAPGNARPGQTRWTPIYWDSTGYGFMVSVVRGVYVDGRFAGVIGSDIVLADTLKFIDEVKGSADISYAFLLDAEGGIVALPEAGQSDFKVKPATASELGQVTQQRLDDGGVPEAAELGAAMQRGEAGVRQFWLADREVMVAFAPLPHTGWSLGVVQPLSVVDAPLQEQNERLIARIGDQQGVTTLGSLGLLLGVLAVTALILRWLFGPLAQLDAQAQAIAARKFDARAEVKGNNELSRLAASFNEMAATVQSSQAALEEANQALERTVARRTGELQNALQRLRAESAARDELVGQLRRTAMPVIPVAAGVLAMPIVGDLDAARGNEFLQTVVRAAQERQARTVILDLTGVPGVSQEGGGLITQAAQALELLGCRVVISGVSPAVAQTLIAQDFQSMDLHTAIDLQSAIKQVLGV